METGFFMPFYRAISPPSFIDQVTSISLQDVALRVREQEEEILQLRKQLAEFSVKVVCCFFSPFYLH